MEQSVAEPAEPFTFVVGMDGVLRGHPSASAADAALPQNSVGYTAYSYVQQIWTLPRSIVTVSLVTALLPRMSRAVAEHRLGDPRTHRFPRTAHHDGLRQWA